MKYNFFILLLFFSLLETLSFAQKGKNKEIYLQNVKVDTQSTIHKYYFPKNLKTKYLSDDFKYEYTLNDEKKSLWDAFKDWLSNLLNDWFNFKTPESARTFISYLFRTMYVVVILIVIYYIVKTFVYKEGNTIFGRKNTKLKIDTENIEKNLLETNLLDNIQEAKSKKHYRLAVRFYYLQSLKDLDKHKHIQWEYEKTNFDFQNQIQNTTIKKQFAYISYLYNYCWYGEFEINNNDFNDIEKAFNSLTKMLQ